MTVFKKYVVFFEFFKNFDRDTVDEADEAIQHGREKVKENGWDEEELEWVGRKQAQVKKMCKISMARAEGGKCY